MGSDVLKNLHASRGFSGVFETRTSGDVRTTMSCGDLNMNTKVTALVLAAMFVVATLVLTAIGRAESIRCGTRLVEVGEDIETLMRSCGPPSYRLTPQSTGGETWYYNRGAAQFMKKVVTLGGKIIAIEDGGYGAASQ
jgi:preprotein translocase subunit SecG